MCGRQQTTDILILRSNFTLHNISFKEDRRKLHIEDLYALYTTRNITCTTKSRNVEVGGICNEHSPNTLRLFFQNFSWTPTHCITSCSEKAQSSLTCWPAFLWNCSVYVTYLNIGKSNCLFAHFSSSVVSVFEFPIKFISWLPWSCKLSPVAPWIQYACILPAFV